MAGDDERAAELGYDVSWLESGVLTQGLLHEQHEHFRGAEGDPNAEHYRARTLADYLARNATLTDAQVTSLLRVARAELRRELHGHVFHELVKHRGLTGPQFSRVSEAWDDAGFKPVALREELIRQLARAPQEDTVLERAQQEGDSFVHGALLALELEVARLEWLAANGANRAVRNQARHQLERRAGQTHK